MRDRFFLFRVKSRVFEQERVAVFQIRNHPSTSGPTQSGASGTGFPSNSARRTAEVSGCTLARLALWPARDATLQNQAATLFQNVLNGREGGLDAGVICRSFHHQGTLKSTRMNTMFGLQIEIGNGQFGIWYLLQHEFE